MRVPALLCTCMLCLALCSTFIRYGANDCYFLLFPLSVGTGVCGLLALWSSMRREGSRFRFTLPDGLLTVAVAYYLFRYDYSQHLADWKVIYALLLLLLWYATRLLSSSNLFREEVFRTGCLLTGALLTGWGMLQLHGLCGSNHYLYRITGPFFNPGPYSGYLALMMAVGLHAVLVAQGWKRTAGGIVLLLTFSIIPATMSRSAWLSIAAGIVCVLALHGRWAFRIRQYIQTAPGKAGIYGLQLLLVAGIAGVALFFLKADSARGRLLIWKNSCHAIAERPLTGYGPGSFQQVYGEAQATYFASGQATESEERVAGYAEYAFNEYLQLGVEGGVIAVVLVLAWGISVFRRGIRGRHYGLCGALAAFAVFAFSSYPMQILPFGIAVVVFAAICTSPATEEVAVPQSPDGKEPSPVRMRLLPPLLAVAVCTTAIIGIYRLRILDRLGKQWYQANTLYYSRLYTEAADSYERLYPQLRYHPEFLRNYAGALQGAQRSDEACRMLEQAQRVSCNFELWNTLGRYHQTAGRYEEAERCYRHSLLLAPSRLYPYYLLANLYMEPSYQDKEKARQMANIVLNKPPKVYSRALREMREEMRTLLGKIKNQ